MEGAPHMAKTIDVPLGCPLPPYIKEEGEEAGYQGRAMEGESY